MKVSRVFVAGFQKESETHLFDGNFLRLFKDSPRDTLVAPGCGQTSGVAPEAGRVLWQQGPQLYAVHSPVLACTA